MKFSSQPEAPVRLLQTSAWQVPATQGRRRPVPAAASAHALLSRLSHLYRYALMLLIKDSEVLCSPPPPVLSAACVVSQAGTCPPRKPPSAIPSRTCRGDAFSYSRCAHVLRTQPHHPSKADTSLSEVTRATKGMSPPPPVPSY